MEAQTQEGTSPGSRSYFKWSAVDPKHSVLAEVVNPQLEIGYRGDLP